MSLFNYLSTLSYVEVFMFSTQLLYSSYCPSLGPKAVSECGTVGEGQQSQPTSRVTGSALWTSQRGSGRRRDCPNVFHYLQHSGCPVL